MVNHLLGHATVNADILASDEACLFAAKKQHHMGYVHGISHPTGRLLDGIGTFVNGISHIYLTRRNGVYPCSSRQAYRQCVRECRNAPFGCRIALGGELSISYREIEPGCDIYFVHDECGWFPEECCVSSFGEPFEESFSDVFSTVKDAINAELLPLKGMRMLDATCENAKVAKLRVAFFVGGHHSTLVKDLMTKYPMIPL